MYTMVERERIELPLERDQSGTKNTHYSNIKNFNDKCTRFVHLKIQNITEGNWAFQAALVVKTRLTMWETSEMRDQSLGQEDLQEESTATHSSTLAWRIPMDRGAWWATAHGVTKSRTQLKWLSTHALKEINEVLNNREVYHVHGL